LLIGNSEFPADPQNLFRLSGPPNDVQAVADALTHANCGLHNQHDVTTLLNADRASVIASLDEFFSSASPSDQLFVYYTGHGWQDVYDRLYLCAADTRTDRLVSSAIADADVTRLWETSFAEAAVIVLDCCYSGSFKGGDPSRSLSGVGRWVLSSSRSGMLSKDATVPDGLSAFTEFLVEALVGGSQVDRDADGFVTVSDVADYVAPRLEAATGQIPHTHFDGSGEVAVARAPGASLQGSSAVEPVEATVGGEVVMVPQLPHSDRPEATSQADQTPTAAVEALDWRQPAEAFESAVVATFRHRNDVDITQFMRTVRREASRAVNHPDGWSRLSSILDRLMCFQALAIEFDQPSAFAAATTSLVRLYELGFDPRGFTAATPATSSGVRPEELWLQILNRLEAVGGLAVRLDRLDLVPSLVLQTPGGHDFRYYTNWFRHALTMAARANLFREEMNGQFVEVGLLRKTYALAQKHPCLLGELPEGDERLYDYLGQFDFLACVAGIAAAGSMDGRSWYPNFSKMNAQRTEPIVRRLITDADARKLIAPVSDIDLALILVGVDQLARKEGVMFSGWWGYHDEQVVAFINQHIADESAVARSPFAHSER
jgi:uncharacterized caspase-like protein